MLSGIKYFSHQTATIDSPCEIGEGTKIWHYSHVMANAKIGNCCQLGQNVFIDSNVILGNNVKVQNNVSIYSGVTCEDNVFLGPSCVFTNVINPRSAISRKEEFRKTLIKNGASIGANATIVCGITIGNFALVGAGAVVVVDIKPFALVVGNPAKQIGWVSEFGVRLDIDKEGFAVCPESGVKYKLDNGILTIARTKVDGE